MDNFFEKFDLTLEEILHSEKALWVSDDGNQILYAAFNDSLVEESKYVVYDNSDPLYPKIESVRYPKPGTRNPQVSLHVIDLADLDNVVIKDIQMPSSLNAER